MDYVYIATVDGYAFKDLDNAKEHTEKNGGEMWSENTKIEWEERDDKWYVVKMLDNGKEVEFDDKCSNEPWICKKYVKDKDDDDKVQKFFKLDKEKQNVFCLQMKLDYEEYLKFMTSASSGIYHDDDNDDNDEHILNGYCILNISQINQSDNYTTTLFKPESIKNSTHPYLM